MAAGECGGRLPSRQASAGLLDVPGAATDSLGESTTRRSITVEGEQIEARRDELERLRAEIAEKKTAGDDVVSLNTQGFNYPTGVPLEDDRR